MKPYVFQLVAWLVASSSMMNDSCRNIISITFSVNVRNEYIYITMANGIQYILYVLYILLILNTVSGLGLSLDPQSACSH